MADPDEVGRRLDDLVRRFEGLADRLDGTYLRGDVFNAYRDAENARFQATDEKVKRLEAQHEADIAERNAQRRLVYGAMLSAVLSIVIAVILSLAHLR